MFIEISKLLTGHPWLRDESLALPLDILIFKLVKSYLHATPFKRAAYKVSMLPWKLELLLTISTVLDFCFSRGSNTFCRKVVAHHACLLCTTIILVLFQLPFFFVKQSQALSKALTEDALFYLRAQFNLLKPSTDGQISLANFRMVSCYDFTFFFMELLNFFLSRFRFQK